MGCLVAVCRDQPFFSVDDWFIATTAMPAGIPAPIGALTVSFPYGDIDAVMSMFAEHPDSICCVILDARTQNEPPPGYLEALRAAVHANGALLVIDEMINGFRLSEAGAQGNYGVVPDLSTFGKALGNGFAVSALAGRRFMERGGLRHSDERVFPLSTTHDLQVTFDAVDQAAAAYSKALEIGDPAPWTGGRPVQPVFRPFA